MTTTCTFWVVLTLLSFPAYAAEFCPNPHQMAGFQTCADPSEAEREGTVVLYSTSPETNSAALLAEFRKAFPKIAPTYI